MKTQTERQAIRDQHRDSWIPVEAGDSIYGDLIDVADGWSEQRQGGSAYPILTIKVIQASGYQEGETLMVHAFGTILYNEVRRHLPEVGERVTITYRGPGKAKTGRSAPELYKLTVEGRQDQAQRAYGRIFGTNATTTAAPSPAQTSPDDEDMPF